MSVVFLKSRELYYEGELLYDKFDTCDNDVDLADIRDVKIENVLEIN